MQIRLLNALGSLPIDLFIKARFGLDWTGFMVLNVAKVQGSFTIINYCTAQQHSSIQDLFPRRTSHES